MKTKVEEQNFDINIYYMNSLNYLSVWNFYYI